MSFLKVVISEHHRIEHGHLSSGSDHRHHAHRFNSNSAEHEPSSHSIFRQLVQTHSKDIKEIEHAIVAKAENMTIKQEVKILSDFEAISLMQMQKLELKMDLLDELEKFLMHEALLVKVG